MNRTEYTSLFFTTIGVSNHYQPTYKQLIEVEQFHEKKLQNTESIYYSIVKNFEYKSSPIFKKKKRKR